MFRATSVSVSHDQRMTRITIRRSDGHEETHRVRESPQEIADAIVASYNGPEIDGVHIHGHFRLTDAQGQAVPINATQIVGIEAIPLKPLPNPKKSWWTSSE